MAQKDLDTMCAELDKRRDKYLMKDKLILVLLLVAMALGAATAITVIFISPPVDLYLALGTGAAGLTTLYFARRIARETKQLYLPDSKLLMLFAYKTHKHLTNFVNGGDSSEKEQALEMIDGLITNWGIRIGVPEKQRKNELDDLEFFVSPMVKLVYSLDNAYLPIIIKGDQHEIQKTKDYFMQLAQFFFSPTEDKLRSLLADALTPDSSLQKSKNTKSISFFNKKPFVKHGITATALSLGTGFLTYYLLAPYVTDDPIPAIQTCLAAVAVVSGFYFGLVYFLSKNK